MLGRTAKDWWPDFYFQNMKTRVAIVGRALVRKGIQGHQKMPNYECYLWLMPLMAWRDGKGSVVGFLNSTRGEIVHRVFAVGKMYLSKTRSMKCLNSGARLKGKIKNPMLREAFRQIDRWI